MKKLVLLCALAGLPLAALADDMQGPGMQGGPGMGMQGQGMGGGMGMQGQGQGMGMGPGGHRPPGPPPEFLQACQGKKEGDTVTVNTPRGPLQGTCRLTFHPSQRPDGAGPGQGQQGQGQQGQGQQGQGQQGQARSPGARPAIR